VSQKEKSLPDKCRLHGKDVPYVSSQIAKAWLCVRCVAEGFYVDKLREEIETRYPENFSLAKAALNHGTKKAVQP